MVEAATLLSTDDFLRAKLRLRAREAVEEHSWETVVALFEADLLAVVGGEGAPVSA